MRPGQNGHLFPTCAQGSSRQRTGSYKFTIIIQNMLFRARNLMPRIYMEHFVESFYFYEKTLKYIHIFLTGTIVFGMS
jgi:hypothetical protein